MVNHVAASFGTDFVVKLFDLAAGQERSRIMGLPEAIYNMQFSYDGNMMVSEMIGSLEGFTVVNGVKLLMGSLCSRFQLQRTKVFELWIRVKEVSLLLARFDDARLIIKFPSVSHS